jgi:hypothetical protein
LWRKSAAVGIVPADSALGAAAFPTVVAEAGNFAESAAELVRSLSFAVLSPGEASGHLGSLRTILSLGSVFRCISAKGSRPADRLLRQVMETPGFRHDAPAYMVGFGGWVPFDTVESSMKFLMSAIASDTANQEIMYYTGDPGFLGGGNHVSVFFADPEFGPPRLMLN